MQSQRRSKSKPATFYPSDEEDEIHQEENQSSEINQPTDSESGLSTNSAPSSISVLDFPSSFSKSSLLSPSSVDSLSVPHLIKLDKVDSHINSSSTTPSERATPDSPAFRRITLFNLHSRGIILTIPPQWTSVKELLIEASKYFGENDDSKSFAFLHVLDNLAEITELDEIQNNDILLASPTRIDIPMAMTLGLPTNAHINPFVLQPLPLNSGRTRSQTTQDIPQSVLVPFVEASFYPSVKAILPLHSTSSSLTSSCKFQPNHLPEHVDNLDKLVSTQTLSTLISTISHIDHVKNKSNKQYAFTSDSSSIEGNIVDIIDDSAEGSGSGGSSTTASSSTNTTHSTASTTVATSNSDTLKRALVPERRYSGQDLIGSMTASDGRTQLSQHHIRAFTDQHSQSLQTQQYQRISIDQSRNSVDLSARSISDAIATHRRGSGSAGTRTSIGTEQESSEPLDPHAEIERRLGFIRQEFSLAENEILDPEDPNVVLQDQLDMRKKAKERRALAQAENEAKLAKQMAKQQAKTKTSTRKERTGGGSQSIAPMFNTALSNINSHTVSSSPPSSAVVSSPQSITSSALSSARPKSIQFSGSHENVSPNGEQGSSPSFSPISSFASATPRDLGSDPSHDSMTVDPASGKIIGLTVDGCIQRLTATGFPDTTFCNMFLLTFKTVLSSEEFLDLLIQRWETSAIPGETNIRSNGVRIRTIAILKQWVGRHPEDFLDEKVSNKILEFATQVTRLDLVPGFSNELTMLLDRYKASLGKNIPSTSGGVNVETSGQLQSFNTNSSLDSVLSKLESSYSPALLTEISSFEQNLTYPFGSRLLDFHPVDLARQLTLIEKSYLNRISPPELLNVAWTKANKKERSPRLMELISWTNYVIDWICTEILGGTTHQERALLITKFIYVAKCCLDMNNFNGAVEICSALHRSSIYRLKLSWNLVSSRTMDLFETVESKFEPDSNFKNYRQAVESCPHPLIPYVARVLSDILFLDEKEPSYLQRGVTLATPRSASGDAAPVQSPILVSQQGPQQVNIVKLESMYSLLQGLLGGQKYDYHFQSDPVIQDYLFHQDILNEKQAYSLSLLRESREVTNVKPTPALYRIRTNGTINFKPSSDITTPRFSATINPNDLSNTIQRASSSPNFPTMVHTTQNPYSQIINLQSSNALNQFSELIPSVDSYSSDRYSTSTNLGLFFACVTNVNFYNKFRTYLLPFGQENHLEFIKDILNIASAVGTSEEASSNHILQQFSETYLSIRSPKFILLPNLEHTIKLIKELLLSQKEISGLPNSSGRAVKLGNIFRPVLSYMLPAITYHFSNFYSH